MKNLIQNPFGSRSEDDKNNHFTRTGISSDNLTIHGYQTASITMTANAPAAVEAYDLPIDVRNGTFLRWGYIMRAVEVQSVQLMAAFYDSEGNHLTTIKHNVTGKVRYQFGCVMSSFPIPEKACTARVSMEIWGKTTACTYFAPIAAIQDKSEGCS